MRVAAQSSEDVHPAEMQFSLRMWVYISGKKVTNEREPMVW